MNKRQNAVLYTIVVAVALVLSPVLPHNAWAPCPCFSGSVQYSTINLNQIETLYLTMTGGTAGQLYQFQVTVTKPGGAGVATNTLSILANSTGGGVGAIQYGSTAIVPAWTPSIGTVNIDLTGVYTASFDETAPKATTNIASTSFTVSNLLRVIITSPAPTGFTRGTTVQIGAHVYDFNNRDYSSATVVAATPAGGTLALAPSVVPGGYTNQYQIQNSDPLGTWNITVVARSSGGNYGTFSTLVSVLATQLVITDLASFNQHGDSTSDFFPGDTLYASFRIAYSGSGFLTTGSFTIQVRNPAGATIGVLQSIYDSNRGYFYTPSGFQVSSSDASGSWQLAFPANSLNDTYGNFGPSTTITYRFQVRLEQSVLNPVYFILAAIAVAGVLGSTLVMRQFNTKTVPFEELFKLTGGEIQPPATLMIVGDAGAGATTLGLQLLYRDLLAGKPCGLLSYDSFPSEIKRKMRDMGWDITAYLERGQLGILDCYSALAGVEDAPIKDPTDFTEVSIRVTGMIEKAKGPTTILLDSVTPIFNSASAKDCINFLQVLGAKVKNSGGMFIFTATKGSIPEEARSKTESLADGVIELSLVKRAKSLARFLMVKKIPGREVSSVETEFQITTGKGLLLRKQRIPIKILRPK